MSAGGGVDEFRRHPQLVGLMLNGARQHVADVEILGDLPRVDGLAFVSQGRVARDDQEVLVAREIGDDVFGHSVGEAARLFIAAQIVERQDGDRRRGDGGGSVGVEEMPGARHNPQQRGDPRRQKREPRAPFRLRRLRRRRGLRLAGTPTCSE